MTGALHEVSAAIGRLEAANEEALRQRERLWLELHAINAKLQCLPLLAERVKRMEPQVEAFARLRQRSLGAAAVVGVAAGALGAAAKLMLE